MRPLNYPERQKAKTAFAISFAITLVFLFMCGAFTLVTAQKGVALLEQRKTDYDEVFKKQAELNFQLDQLFRDLNNLKTKGRNSSEHKQMQKLITNVRMLMEEDITTSSEKERYHSLYLIMLEQIKVIQSTMDMFERESSKRQYNMEQLEKCRQKYQELTKKKIN